jgi:hypothetical protein
MEPKVVASEDRRRLEELIAKLAALTPHWTTEGCYLVPIPADKIATNHGYGWVKAAEVKVIADELAAVVALPEGLEQEQVAALSEQVARQQEALQDAIEHCDACEGQGEYWFRNVQMPCARCEKWRAALLSSVDGI